METEGRAAQVSGVFHANGVSSAILQDSLDAGAVGACVMRSGLLLYADPAALRLLEARDVEIVGRKLSDLVEPDDRKWIHHSVESTDASPWHSVTLASRRNGRVELQLDPEEPETRCRRVWFRHPAQGTDLKEEPENTEQMPRRNVPPTHATVLICDDEARLAALTAGLLEEYGFSPLTAALGDEALSIVSHDDPRVDVLLLDVNLSAGLSAQDLLGEVSQREHAPQVILTSGLAEEDVPDELRRHARVAGYLAKPYSVEQLVSAIENALSQSVPAR